MGGLITPRRYAKIVARRKKVQSLLKWVENEARMLTVVGVVSGVKVKSPAIGGLVGYLLGTAL